MTGGIVLSPILMGFDNNTALLFSGIGTILFFLCTGGKVPSYLGSSFAFIGVVNSATGFKYVPGGARNPHIDVGGGGILICGVIYLAISIGVMLLGSRWLEILMPPVVTGAVVLAIGLNLSFSAIKQASTTEFDAYMALVTVLAVSMVMIYAPGVLKRFPVLIGGLFGYFVYLFFGLGGIGPGIDFSEVSNSKWIGAPPTTLPVFEGNAISIIAPVAIILAAENIGHVKAIGSMSGRSLDNLLGRAFLGDSLATILAGLFGSIGVTTYAENIGVMSISKNFSTLTFLIAGSVAIILGVIPVFGAIVRTIPPGVFGGISIVLFGIIAITGTKIWILNDVDFSKPRNLLTGGIPVVLGCGMVDGVMVSWGVFKIDGIGCATLGAIILYQFFGISKLYYKIRGIKSKDDENETNSKDSIIGTDDQEMKTNINSDYETDIPILDPNENQKNEI
eukprot:gene2894-3596_t